MSVEVIWLGHASALLRAGDRQVLVDPLGRARSLASGPVDAVLITHAHVDHLNRWTLRKIDKAARLIVPVGAKSIVSNMGFSTVEEVEPGDHFSIGDLDVVTVPTRHDSGRWHKGDLPLCVGYVFMRGGVTVHHAGDVDMSTYEVFDEIGKQFQIATTLLPIGGMLPPWYYRNRRDKLDRGVHICPETALGIAQRLGAINMVPIHWGTVNLRLFHRKTAPRDDLLRAAESEGVSSLVKVLAHGQSLQLETTK